MFLKTVQRYIVFLTGCSIGNIFFDYFRLYHIKNVKAACLTTSLLLIRDTII